MQVDKLYLQREGPKDITIDLPTPLPQHQLDGIRFLFKVYKKKAPGVILNDPSGYGKCLQTVLFLNAVRPTLKKPILVLSNSVNNWIEHFQIWTDCCDELAVEVTNPFIKKQVFVNPIKDGVLLSRRYWSIIVLHDEYSAEKLLQLCFNADYKIWITSNDLKGNLYTLASIYEWLHPNQKFNVDQFTAKKSNRQDVVEKALLLDAFLEDFLIRRTDFYSPFPKAAKFKPSLPSPVKATRKNKDPTGTKVKRSKKRRIEDEVDNIVNNKTNETTNKNNVSTNNMSVTNAADNNMDVESFIRNEKPIESEEFNFIQNTYKNPQDDDADGDTMEIDFREAVNELVENEKSINHSSNEDSRDVLASPNICEENDATQEYVLEIKENDNEVGILVPGTEETGKSENTERKSSTSKYIEDNNVSLIQGVIIPETESENSTYKEESSQINDSKIEDNDSKNEKSLPQDKDSDKYKSINGNTNGADNDNTKSNKDLVKNKSKIDEFDAELAEFEARALKKFKSSILDSIF